MNNLKIIVKMKFGSHLYGTDTKDSDLDYKGIFLPSKEEILLNKIPNSYNFTTKENSTGKNTSSDVDNEIYSLHYFLKLACEGQTVAIDMLHAPESMILESSYTWKRIVANRDKFYTKNLNAFVGYARKQAAKYGIKGSRLNEAKVLIDFLSNLISVAMYKDIKLKYVWDVLPVGEHCKYIEDNKNGIKQYMVNGKILQETMRVDYALDIIKKYYDAYGKRAKQAAKNEGIDWKAVSHAIRAALQLKELLLYKTITFPLKEAETVKEIKQGKFDYLSIVSPMLEGLMQEVEDLSLVSDFPAKVNRKYWDTFLIEVLKREVFYDF